MAADRAYRDRSALTRQRRASPSGITGLIPADPRSKSTHIKLDLSNGSSSHPQLDCGIFASSAARLPLDQSSSGVY